MNNIINFILFTIGVITGVCTFLSIKLYNAYKRIDELHGELEFIKIKLGKIDYIFRIISNKFNYIDSENDITLSSTGSRHEA